jgi:hypothetical protein
MNTHLSSPPSLFSLDEDKVLVMPVALHLIVVSFPFSNVPARVYVPCRRQDFESGAEALLTKHLLELEQTLHYGSLHLHSSPIF